MILMRNCLRLYYIGFYIHFLQMNDNDEKIPIQQLRKIFSNKYYNISDGYYHNLINKKQEQIEQAREQAREQDIVKEKGGKKTKNQKPKTKKPKNQKTKKPKNQKTKNQKPKTKKRKPKK